VQTREGELSLLSCKSDRFCEPEFQIQGCCSLGNMRPQIRVGKSRTGQEGAEENKNKAERNKAREVVRYFRILV
jgi:hypothetical protein